MREVRSIDPSCEKRNSEPRRDGMASCEIYRRAIVRRDRFQEAQGLAKGPRDGHGCSPGRRPDPGSETRLTAKPDDQGCDVGADEHCRGLQPAKSTRVLTLSTNRSQFDDGTGVPPSYCSRPRSHSPIGLINPHQPSDRSAEDALRTSSLSRISLGGQSRCSTKDNDSGLTGFSTLASRIYASVISHLCRSMLTFALHSFRATRSISDDVRRIGRALNPSYACSTTSPASAHSSDNRVAV